MPLPLHCEQSAGGPDPECDPKRDPDEVRVVEALDGDQDGRCEEDPHVEARHEETKEGEEHGGQAANHAHTDGDAHVSPDGEGALFYTDQEDDDGGQDEANEEHDGFEASITCNEREEMKQL